MENLRHYNKFRKPPQTALKKINGGRMNGKTDINPQWRYEALTDEFGPCGIGWYYEVTGKEMVPYGDEVAVFVDVNLYVKEGEEWSKPIPGNGGSMFATKEKNGIHVSDECYKMATTDALSVAFKMLGGAGDIYAGKWDGSKYIDQPTNGKAKAEPKAKDFKGKEKEYPLDHIGDKRFKTLSDLSDEQLSAMIDKYEKANVFPETVKAAKAIELPFKEA